MKGDKSKEKQTFYQKVCDGFRVTLPKELCAEMGIKEGDIIIVERIGNSSIFLNIADVKKKSEVDE